MIRKSPEGALGGAGVEEMTAETIGGDQKNQDGCLLLLLGWRGWRQGHNGGL